MRQGLRLGESFSFDVFVTPEMRAAFGDITVHEVYSTPKMLEHMEWASRQHILPYLEDGEEGYGYRMILEHRAPTPMGETVTITAVVSGLKPERVICECTAFSQGRLVGKGTIIQAVLSQAKVRAKIAAYQTP